VNNTVAGIVARICEHIIQNPADPGSTDAVLGGGRLGQEAVVNAAMRAAYRAHGLANAPPLTLIAPTFEKQRRRFVLTVRRLDPQALHQKSVTSIFVIAKNMRLDPSRSNCLKFTTSRQKISRDINQETMGFRCPIRKK
jgi:hypothetical protein